MFYPCIEDSGGRQNMSEMSRADTELTYKYLNDRVRSNVVADAYDRALTEFESIDALQAAHDNPDSSFTFEGITFEFERHNRDRDELVPLTGIEHTDEPEVSDLASDFGWAVIDEIRDEIRSMQDETILSPREFVALVLDADWGEQNAATIMDVSVGNFRGKKGSIADKLDRAETTQTRVEEIRAE